MITERTYRNLYLELKHHELYKRSLNAFGEYDPRTAKLKQAWLNYNFAVSVNTQTLADIEAASAWRNDEKAFFVVDSEPHEWEAYKLNYTPADEENAIIATKTRYNRMSDHDANLRDAFYLCYAPVTEDELPDLDRAIIILTIK